MVDEVLSDENMSDENMSDENMPKCFVIMPISDPDGYEAGHFKHVYNDLFRPACKKAGYKAVRADDFHSSSMIHVNIVREIIDAEIAICDLSSRNPNVLFELGIRQAFDLPVVLVQEKGTPRIFDIGTFNTIDYRRGLVYHEVIEDRIEVFKGLKATKEDKKGINSIIKLLELDKASMGETKMTSDNEDKLMLYNILNKLSNLESKIDYNEMMSQPITNNVISKSDFTILPMKELEDEIMETAIFKGEKEALSLIEKVKKTVKELNSLSDAEKSRYMNRLGKIQNSIER